MSRGLSNLQRTIVDLLDGTERWRIFACSGEATTSELLAELEIRGMVRSDIPRKTAMFTVRRACLSLLDRDVLEGEYAIDIDHPWAYVATWRLKSRKKRNLKSG